jgi:CHAD domain-containing protein
MRKNQAIKKVKAEKAALEKEYAKAVEEKNELAAEMAKYKWEQKVAEEKAMSKNGFYETAESSGEVRDMDEFRFNVEHYVPKFKDNPAIEEFVMASKKPYAVLETLLDFMAERGYSAETLVKQETPFIRRLISDINAEVNKQSEPAPAKAPAKQSQPAPAKAPPPSVVASVGKDSGQQATLDMKKASMEDVIRHVRKFGGAGIQ